MASITSYGAAQEVTGSRHLFNYKNVSLLLDCGLFQGKRTESYDKTRKFPFAVDQLSGVVLSHAHLDHSGALPRLYQLGYRGKIYTTPATAELLEHLLLDSAHLQVKDIEFVNKKHRKRGLPEFKPLYTPEDIPPILEKIEVVDYGKPFYFSNHVSCTLFDAGHILGSSQIVIEWGNLDEPNRFIFTGDLGRKNLPILNDPYQFSDADSIMIESTYGGRNHDPIEFSLFELKEEILRIIENRGCILIPAFSVERTQEILYSIQKLHLMGYIEEIPIYLDSPLATHVTEVFQHHTHILDKEFNEILKISNPFGKVHFTKTVEESMALNTKEGPLIVIAGSGMCEGGRIVHHLRNRLMNPNTTVLIVGFMAKNTLGRKLADREPQVSIFGETIQRKARVKIINSFSGHAGQSDLVDYVKKFNHRLRKVMLVHGEIEQQEILREKILAERPTLEVVINQEAVPVQL
ncbi:MAG: MBL fold metallo-hydrolase [bacterium]|nr:MBL fold metallo-hydrolase [bacterium]